MVPYCSCCLDTGWICELHPTKPMGHDRCTGTGRPCMNAEYEHGRRNIADQERNDAYDRLHYPKERR
jgi:hypothetical protein